MIETYSMGPTMKLRVLTVCCLVALTSCSTFFPAHDAKSKKSTSNAKPPTLTEPHQVAVLLPLQGSLQAKATTVRDGFLAAYYQAPGKATISMVDTQKSLSINKYYDDAQKNGAKFIVGPLEKDQVSKIAHRSKLPVPTLALNYTDDKLPAQMYEFGLSPQDEVEQVAARAWSDGRRKALIVTSSDAWGKRMGTTLMSKWHQKGGTIVANMSLSANKNIIDQLQAMVPGVGEKNKLVKPSFDVVLLAATPEQARSTASMFRFYGLGNIPIYATSAVYSGMPSPADKDLEGVRFCDIPWVINPTAEMTHATEQLRATHPEADFDIRLYALGIDAYRVIYQLPQLAAGSTYHGVTGALSMDNQRIRRVLSCGQFVNGQIIPLS